MRWVVGDVQGCARELEALLEAVRFDSARDELVSVGDLVNKGPDSLAVLRLWYDVGGRGVLGNHDVYALCAYSGRMERRPSDTLQALFDAPDAQELLDALRALPVMLKLPDRSGDGASTWVVHGGVHPANEERGDRGHFADVTAGPGQILQPADVSLLHLVIGIQ